MKKMTQMKRWSTCAVAVLLLTLCAVALSVSASAATSGYYTYTVSNGEAMITDVDTSISGNVTIPSTLGGYPVTSIGFSAFEDCTGLTSITIPSSVTSIGSLAFRGCSSLTSITVADGNTAYHAAGNCLIKTASKTLIAGCQSSVIPTDGSVTSIGSYAFSGCSGLTSITIPSSVTSIGSSAFEDCTGLTSITIPSSVTSIGWYAFYKCTGLTSITIPSSVTSIDNWAFSYCSSLTSITVADGNTAYHAAGNCLIETASKTLIAGCKTSVIPADGSVTSIGSSAFRGCSALTSITIPEGVTSIGSSAFRGCSGLTSITIPSSVTSIGSSAFSGCSGLTSITIPSNVTSIGEGAFWRCSALTSITLPFVGAQKNGTSNTHFGYIFGASSYSDNDDYVPASLKTVVITGGTSIGSDAFKFCSGLTSVILLSPNTEIYDSANTIPASATIYGHAGSTAQAYAEKYGLSFAYILPPCSSEEIFILDGEDLLGRWTASPNCNQPFTSADIAQKGKSGALAYEYCGILNGEKGAVAGGSSGINIMYVGWKFKGDGMDVLDVSETGYLRFDLYVSHPEVLAGIQFNLELTSDGGPDKFENSWTKTFEELKGSPLEEGWNTIEIALDSYTKVSADGGMDPTGFNYMRIYNIHTINTQDEFLTIGLDNVRFTATSERFEAATAKAFKIMEMLEPLAEIEIDDINENNYDTVKKLYESAFTAYNNADTLVRELVNQTYEAATIYKTVGDALAKYEELLRCRSQVNINSAKITLGSDITVYYTVTLPEHMKDAVMTFTAGSKTATVKGEPTGTNNRYTFAFKGITPQMMGDNIAVVVTYDHPTLGELEVASKAEYSVKQYCTNMITKVQNKTLGLTDAQYAALGSLLADTLEYGAAAQVYMGHNVNNLVNEGITGQTVFVPLTSEYRAGKPSTTTAEDGTRLRGATAILDNTIRLKFTLYTYDINRVSLVVDGVACSADDFRLVEAASDFDGLDTYEITLPAVRASGLNRVYDLSLVVDGEVCQTYSYGLVNYLYSKQNDSNEKLVDLIRAIRNYGLSATAYQSAMK